jgi:hypothetical protein
MSSTKPFAILKEDHKKIAALFAKIEDTTERAEKTREEVFAELRERLEHHTDTEEKYVYPVLEETEVMHDLTLEAEEEHAVAKTLLTELASEDCTTEQWTAKLTVLRENIEHHVKEEEEELFPKSEKNLDAEELEQIDENLKAAYGQE